MKGEYTQLSNALISRVWDIRDDHHICQNGSFWLWLELFRIVGVRAQLCGFKKKIGREEEVLSIDNRDSYMDNLNGIVIDRIRGKEDFIQDKINYNMSLWW